MPEPTSAELAAKRDEVVHGHLDTYASTLAVLSEIPVDDWERPTGCPGWSVRSVISHMIGIERFMLGDPFPELRLDPVPDHVTTEFGAFTEVDVAVRADHDPDRLLAEATEVFARRREAVEALSPEDMGTVIRGAFGEGAAIKVLGTRLFDLWAHEQDIRRAVGRPGHLQGPAADLFWKRATRGLQRGLAGRVDGLGEVSIAIGQPEERAISFTVGEGTTVGLATDLSNFVALTCGRDDAQSGAVGIEGDPDLGARVLASMAITP
ncbi:MAG: maleylpyruvate isomerase family mycothiol-dependent enzyme [Nitriliruptorales bacterium]|nr:maleylpyruvate isomerase family mycothiol-dependent enzyme [Nitriliruptorales bacterium]